MKAAFRLAVTCLLLASAIAVGCSCRQEPEPADAQAQVENFGWAMTESNWVTPTEEILAPWLDVTEAEIAGNAAMHRTLGPYTYHFTPVVQEMPVHHGTGSLDSLVAVGFANHPEITADNFVGWGTAGFMWEADTSGAEPSMHVKLLIVRTHEGVRIGSYTFGDSLL